MGWGKLKAGSFYSFFFVLSSFFKTNQPKSCGENIKTRIFVLILNLSIFCRVKKKPAKLIFAGFFNFLVTFLLQNSNLLLGNFKVKYNCRVVFFSRIYPVV